MLRRNQYYGGNRPHHVDGFDVDLRAASPQEMLQRVDRGDADWGHTLSGIYFDPALRLVEKYGLNRSRLFLRPGLDVAAAGLQLVAAAVSRQPVPPEGRQLRAEPARARRCRRSAREPPERPVPPVDHAGVQGRAGVPARASGLAAREGARATATCEAGRPFSTSTARRSRWRSGSWCGSSSRRSGSTSRCGGSRSTAPRPRTSTSSQLRASRGTSRSACWSPSYIDPFAYINLLFERRFLGGTNFARFASAPYDGQMRRAARLPQGSGRSSAYGRTRRPPRSGCGAAGSGGLPQRADA